MVLKVILQQGKRARTTGKVGCGVGDTPASVKPPCYIKTLTYVMYMYVYLLTFIFNVTFKTHPFRIQAESAIHLIPFQLPSLSDFN